MILSLLSNEAPGRAAGGFWRSGSCFRGRAQEAVGFWLENLVYAWLTLAAGACST